jgi:superoxide reductase
MILTYQEYPISIPLSVSKYVPTRIGKVIRMKACDVYKTAESEGKEKHVPEIEICKGEGRGDKDVVRIIVGKEVSHPNTVEHHISWAQLMGVKENGMVIDLGKTNFAPSFTEPSADFHVPLSEFKTLIATSYCNIHGLWENSIDL